ncbi:MAG: methionyl-tRNA formyltransferase [Candidatus Paceibacterota bacterium]
MTHTKAMSTSSFIFFGSSRLSIIVLDELFSLGLIPSAIVTSPDKPQGRKLTLTANPVKIWGNSKNIPVFDPVKLDNELTEKLLSFKAHYFLVASFGTIIPNTIINLPPKKSLNIHPSLLPKYRGPSPLPTAILDDSKKSGVTIMVMDSEMDHGPILATKEVVITEWPIYEDYEEMMAKEGARLFVETIPKWLGGEIKPQEQDHAAATYTRKMTKEDGLLDLNADEYLNFRKIQAYHEWPQAYFFQEHNGEKIRVKVTQASFKDGHLIIEKVLPESGKVMRYEDFERGYVKE